jgi:hypothetical protein
LLGNIETNPTLTKILKSKITAKAFRTKYISKLIEKQETEAMAGMLAFVKKMEPEEIDSYINLSVEKGTVEITNRLIEYQNKLYPIEKVFEMQNEEMEKAIGIREKKLSDYRKEFKISKDEDGLYQIKEYKGNATTVEIPGTIQGIAVKIADSEQKYGEYQSIFPNKSVEHVYIGDGVTYIGKGAFSGCANLQSITIPDSVTSIGSWAFSGCTSLQSITIGNSVTSIGNWAFSDCEKLTIHAPAGSYAETYAIEKRIEFQEI